MLPDGSAGRVVIRIVLEIVHEKEVARRKAPEVADPGTVGMEVIHFIDAPVVRRMPGQLTRIVAFIAECFGGLKFR